MHGARGVWSRSLTCSCHSREATALGSVSRLHPPGAIPAFGNSGILVSCARIPLVPPWGQSSGTHNHQSTSSALCSLIFHLSTWVGHCTNSHLFIKWINRSIAPLVMGLITRRLLRAPARGHRHSGSSRSQPWSHTGSRAGSGAATDQQPRGSTQPRGNSLIHPVPGGTS